MFKIAYRGRAPKDPSERLRKNKPAFAVVSIDWDGKVRGPELPDEYPWCNYSVAEWEAFRRSPQSMLCVDSDWSYLLDTWLLHDRMWRDPLSLTPAQLSALSAEYRRRMGAYGVTFEDRQKQRITIRSPQEEAEKEAQILAEATEAVDYLSAINSEVARRRKTQE